jgi:hypothetical protein
VPVLEKPGRILQLLPWFHFAGFPCGRGVRGAAGSARYATAGTIPAGVYRPVPQNGWNNTTEESALSPARM